MADDYTDKYVRRNHRVNRVASGEAVKQAGANASTQSRIAVELDKLNEPGLTAVKRRAVARKITNLLRTQFVAVGEDVEDIAEKMVASEIKWQHSTFGEYTNSLVNNVPLEEAFQVAKSTSYQGKTFSKWFETAGVRQYQKVTKIIESGFVTGRSIPDIQRGVLDITKKYSRNTIKTLVRSNLMHASAVGRDQIIGANEELLDGSIWNSTLDIRTTINICAPRDQLRYDNNNSPIDHNMPFGEGPGRIHFNCRSIKVPKMKGIDIETRRPSIGGGDEYKRGDFKTNRGTIRKPSKSNKESGIFKTTIKRSGTNYESWLRSQKTDFVADAFNNKQKALLFKEGASLDSLIVNPLGTNLSINQL